LTPGKQRDKVTGTKPRSKTDEKPSSTEQADENQCALHALSKKGMK